MLLLTAKTTASIKDAHMFLFAIDGAMVQLLSANSVDERDKLLDYFLFMLSEHQLKLLNIKSP